ncbi:MAG: hypothetical protein WBZ48_10050 [Bacteroidota bacterium]
MERIFLIIFALLVSTTTVFTDNQPPIEKGPPTINVSANLPDSLVAKIDLAVQAANCNSIRNLSWGQDLLVSMPVLLLLLLLFVSLAVLKRTGFNLGDALSENEPVQKTIPNPNANLATAKPTINISEYPQSSSRLLAFLTSIVAIVLVISATTYSFYVGLKFGKMPDLGSLQTFALSLGVGVVPYAFNRIANAIKA